jgi:hypothetical protein
VYKTQLLVYTRVSSLSLGTWDLVASGVKVILMTYFTSMYYLLDDVLESHSLKYFLC